MTAAGEEGERMKPGKVRPLALCVIRDGERILVQEGYDPAKGQTFYRALGGGIEFGERSQHAAAREIREELGAEVTDLEFLATLESVFVFDGLPGHEIALVYMGRFADPALNARPILTGAEGDGTPLIAVWKRLDELSAGTSPPLYPEGLLELLSEDLGEM
jgi:ADP-ribose pyrophosphatase YjhB (NUDIX family)